MRPKVKITGTNLQSSSYQTMETALKAAFTKGISKAKDLLDPNLFTLVKIDIEDFINNYRPWNWEKSIYSYVIMCSPRNNTLDSLRRGYVFCSVVIVYQSGEVHHFDMSSQ
jgi:hypothetical protein